MNTPNIWIPKTRILEPNRELIVSARMQGWYRLEAIRPDGRRRLLADWFPNLITDAGLNGIGTLSTLTTACKVGTGTNAPANGDTALQTHVAGTGTVISTSGTAQASAPYFGARTKTYQFAAGVAAGNLAEVGIGTATANTGTLFSRARILDGGGSPTTITVLSDEILNVTYQLRRYPALVDVTGTISLNAIDYDYTVRMANVTTSGTWGGDLTSGGGGGGGNSCTAYDGAIGAITTLPSGATSSGSTTNASYGNNNLYRDFSCDFSITQGNLTGGIDAMAVSFGTGAGNGQMQVGFSPAIPKTSSDVLSITMRHIWARGSI